MVASSRCMPSEGRVQMRSFGYRSRVLGAFSLMVVALAVTACSSTSSSSPAPATAPGGGGPKVSTATASASRPAAASTGAPSVSAVPVETSTRAPSVAVPTGSPTTEPTTEPTEVPTFTGSAKASVTVGATALVFQPGRCDVGANDAYLAVNIGTPAIGADYFGLLAGQHPAAQANARSAKGGGIFTGTDVLITFRQGSTGYLLHDQSLTLAADLRSGSFTATDTTSGSAVSGTFSC
jgi:hypothetical protein